MRRLDLGSRLCQGAALEAAEPDQSFQLSSLTQSSKCNPSTQANSLTL
jgi:hypothetical protein